MIIGKGIVIEFKNPVSFSIGNNNVKMELIDEYLYFSVQNYKYKGLHIPDYFLISVELFAKLQNGNVYRIKREMTDFLALNSIFVAEIYLAKKGVYRLGDKVLTFSVAKYPQKNPDNNICMDPAVFKTAMIILKMNLKIRNLVMTVMSLCGDYFYNGTAVDLEGKKIVLSYENLLESKPLIDFYGIAESDKKYLILCMKHTYHCPGIFDFASRFRDLGNNKFIYKYEILKAGKVEFYGFPFSEYELHLI